MQRTPCLVALVLVPAVVATALAQDPRRERAAETAGAEELYFPERPDLRALFFGLDGELDEEKLDKELVRLEDPDSALLWGPESFRTRPSTYFVAVETGAAVRAKDFAKALKRAGGKPQELAWMVARWRPSEVPAGGGRGNRGGGSGGVRGQLLSMSGDIRWVEGSGDLLVFYYTPKKLDADDLFSRFEKVFTRSGRSGDELGLEVVIDSIEWLLEGPVDPAEARKAEKAIAKLDGVTLATIDPTAGRLLVTVRLEGLVPSGPPGKLGGGGGGRDGASSGLRPCFDTLPLFDVLERFGLTVVVPEEDEEAGEAPAEPPAR